MWIRRKRAKESVSKCGSDGSELKQVEETEASANATEAFVEVMEANESEWKRRQRVRKKRR